MLVCSVLEKNQLYYIYNSTFDLIMSILKVLVTVTCCRVQFKSLDSINCFIYCCLHNISVVYCKYIVPYLLYLNVFYCISYIL